jgi:hypothetical protein
MTTTFSPEAQQLFDRYLETVRWSVRGVADADEVEHDVREHVASALETQEEPVSSHTLRDVLYRLGDPWQWVAPEDLPFWRRIVMRFSLGPEDWRLAYLCFGLTILGILLMPVGIGLIFLGAAFLLGRATIALSSDRGDSLGARRWLIYPPLVLISSIAVLIAIIGPAGPFVGWGIGDHGFERIIGVRFSPESVQMFLFYAGAVLICFGAWWITLSAIVAIAIRPVRWLLVPLMNGLRRVHLAWLGGIGALASAIGVVMLMSSR